MIIKFQKFQGAGNDFIIIDNRNQVYEFTREIVEYFCDRKFGIGADGLMLLETCPGYDFKMRYFNSDGREASLCGNGRRGLVAHAPPERRQQMHRCLCPSLGPVSANHPFPGSRR